jgi:HSP20 family molecular chaperone IbpA
VHLFEYKEVVRKHQEVGFFFIIIIISIKLQNKQRLLMQICRAPVRNTLSRNSRTLKHISSRPLITTPTRKMSLFQRNFYTPETSFTPLFRLLEDFDNYSREGNGTHQSRRSGLAHWQPKFDVRETDSAYELHGELPGMSKENVSIEFTDSQSMLVRGKVERTYTSGTPPAGALEGTTAGGAITEGNDGEEQSKSSSHKPTVEDATEDGTPVPSASSEGAEGEVAQTTQAKKPTDSAKYWLTERSVGEFSRAFSFPTRVNQDDVTASFKDGILNITVPKAAKHEPRRITVN